MDKLENTPDSTREGGRDQAKLDTPELSGDRLRRARNSSGEASAAANMLDLRQKVNFALEMIQQLALSLHDDHIATQVKQYRQQGFRFNRGPRG